MKREPWVLYLFRLLLSIGLFAIIAMLYWSSLLVEQDLRTLHVDFRELKNDLYELKNEMMSHPLQRGSGPVDRGSATTNGQKLPLANPSLPNLLIPDPFYTTTLPKMLGDQFAPKGTYRTSTVGKPDSLHPFNNWRDVSDWYSLCISTPSSNQFGKYETLAPNLALRMEEREREDIPGKEYWIFLRDEVYWQPLKQSFFSDGPKLDSQFLEKHKVTAHDFKFYFDALMNPYNQEPGAVSRRVYLEGIDKVEVLDDLTFVVKWKAEEVLGIDGQLSYKVRYVAPFTTGGMLHPLPSFVYKYFADGSKILEEDADVDSYLTSSIWAQNFSQHWAKNVIVSCGAWIFDGMTEREIRFVRNPDYYNPYEALMRERVTTFRNSGDSIWQDFKVLNSDTYTLTPEKLTEFEEFQQTDLYLEQVAKGKAIETVQYIGSTYLYIGWNEARPLFVNKEVRQALTMAIDRKRIIDYYLQGFGVEITGPFSRYSNAYNHNIIGWPFDPLRAREVLEEQGWYDSDGDGWIDKEINGERVPFRFALTYYVKNQTGKAIAEYISTTLKQVGIDCVLNGVEIADLSAVFDGKSFDALLLGWAGGSPPENPAQLWSSSGAKEPGSSNAVGFANAEADQIIQALIYEDNHDERTRLYHRFGEIIHDEAPYTFLYTPKSNFLFREYVQNVFVPADRQDLIPGANVFEPSSTVFWLSEPQPTP